MSLGANDYQVTKVYNGSVNATEVEVTDNPNVHIHSITLLNATAAEAYLQVWDLDADDVTVGTTAPTFVIGVDTLGQLHCQFPKPINFLAGFTIASTTTRAGNTNAVMEVTITFADKA